jgi:serine/threonine protein kinase
LRALKVLPVSRVNSAAWFARFCNGAYVATRVSHQNVAGSYDIGVQKKHHFIVMEYVDGANLQTIVANHGPLEWHTAVNYLRQAAEGVAHLHERGIIHRDVKPAHLVVDRNGTVRLLSLSMARSTDGRSSPMTGSDEETEWESYDFLAPEQARDPALVDPRTDIYSLGCTLYFLVTSHPPFAPGSNRVQRILMHQANDPPDVSESRPDVPPILANLCSRMMARSPDDRPQTATEVIAGLISIV